MHLRTPHLPSPPSPPLLPPSPTPSPPNPSALSAEVVVDGGGGAKAWRRRPTRMAKRAILMGKVAERFGNDFIRVMLIGKVQACVSASMPDKQSEELQGYVFLEFTSRAVLIEFFRHILDK